MKRGRNLLFVLKIKYKLKGILIIKFHLVKKNNTSLKMKLKNLDELGKLCRTQSSIPQSKYHQSIKNNKCIIIKKEEDNK